MRVPSAINAAIQAAIDNGTATARTVNGQVLVSDRAVAGKLSDLQKLVVQVFVEEAPKTRSEATFQRLIVELAHALGWKVTHVRPARVKRDGKETYRTAWGIDGVGSFDCDFYRERHFKAELKWKYRLMTDEQKLWQGRYTLAGVENYVWYPKHAEEIAAVLTRYEPPLRRG